MKENVGDFQLVLVEFITPTIHILMKKYIGALCSRLGVHTSMNDKTYKW